MRVPVLSLFAACSVLLAACTTNEASSLRPSPTAPASIGFNDPSRVDTVGMPDLIVDPLATQQHWVVRDENLPANFCSVIEGGVQAGNHRIIRFTVTTPNIGDADVFVGSPLKHMDPNGDGSFADADGLFEFAKCHQHFHFQHYASYALVDAATGKVWKAAKRGFCMLDTDPYNMQSGDGAKNYENCGDLSHDGFQGISHGFSDTYVFKLGGQYFVLDGGDGQAVVPPGDYFIEVEVNPAYAPDKRGSCPRVTDPATGLCHQFAEASYANNKVRVPVTIPAHPGRDGYGPDKGYTFPTKSEDVDHSGS